MERTHPTSSSSSSYPRLLDEATGSTLPLKETNRCNARRLIKPCISIVLYSVISIVFVNVTCVSLDLTGGPIFFTYF